MSWMDVLVSHPQSCSLHFFSCSVPLEADPSSASPTVFVWASPKAEPQVKTWVLLVSWRLWHAWKWPFRSPLQERMDCPCCKARASVLPEVMPALPRQIASSCHRHPETEWGGGGHSAPQETPRICYKLLAEFPEALLIPHHVSVYPSAQTCFFFFLSQILIALSRTPNSTSESASREPNLWQSWSQDSGVKKQGRRESQYKGVLSKPKIVLGPLRRVQDVS